MQVKSATRPLCKWMVSESLKINIQRAFGLPIVDPEQQPLLPVNPIWIAFLFTFFIPSKHSSTSMAYSADRRVFGGARQVDLGRLPSGRLPTSKNSVSEIGFSQKPFQLKVSMNDDNQLGWFFGYADGRKRKAIRRKISSRSWAIRTYRSTKTAHWPLWMHANWTPATICARHRTTSARASAKW